MEEQKPITIAAFDFDGTITQTDSMFGFVRYVSGKWRYRLGLIWLGPLFIKYRYKWITPHRAKEVFLSHYLGGKTDEELKTLGEKFSREIIPKILRPKAIEKLRWHQQEGHRCFVVTASMAYWIKPWALENGLEFVGTRHEVANGVFTGKIDGKNCAGPEKVNRLLEILGNQEIEKSYAYGDTSGDKEMLEWADEGGYRCF